MRRVRCEKTRGWSNLLLKYWAYGLLVSILSVYLEVLGLAFLWRENIPAGLLPDRDESDPEREKFG